MRTATFQFSESGGSVNGPNLFTELPFPVEILTKPLIHWIASPLCTENPFFSLRSASSASPSQKSALIEVIHNREVKVAGGNFNLNNNLETIPSRRNSVTFVWSKIELGEMLLGGTSLRLFFYREAIVGLSLPRRSDWPLSGQWVSLNK